MPPITPRKQHIGTVLHVACGKCEGSMHVVQTEEGTRELLPDKEIIRRTFAGACPFCRQDNILILVDEHPSGDAPLILREVPQ